MRERQLNSAGRIADYFIESKLTPVFVLLCLAALVVAAVVVHCHWLAARAGCRAIAVAAAVDAWR